MASLLIGRIEILHKGDLLAFGKQDAPEPLSEDEAKDIGAQLRKVLGSENYLIVPPVEGPNEEQATFDEYEAYMHDLISRAQLISNEVRGAMQLPLANIGEVGFSPIVKEPVVTQVVDMDIPEDLEGELSGSYTVVGFPDNDVVTDSMLVKAFIETFAQESELRREAVKATQAARAEGRELTPDIVLLSTSTVVSEAEEIATWVLSGFNSQQKAVMIEEPHGEHGLWYPRTTEFTIRKLAVG